MIDCKVNDMAAAERHAIESLLGASLNADQQVFVMAYTPTAEPSDAARQVARAGLSEIFAKIDKYAAEHGISEEEAEAAIEEAMQHVRPRRG